MALIFETNRPEKLLESLKNAVRAGSIAWEIDEDGDFTYSPQKWKYEAWLHPSVGKHRLTFYILPPKTDTITTEVYAVYHARFLQMMLTYFDELFDSCRASAQPEGADKTVGSEARKALEA